VKWFAGHFASVLHNWLAKNKTAAAHKHGN
jgi:hypothetical protein